MKKPTRKPRVDDITGTDSVGRDSDRTEVDNSWQADFAPGAKIESILPPEEEIPVDALDKMLAEAGQGGGRSDEEILRELLAQPEEGAPVHKEGSTLLKSDAPKGVGAIDTQKLKSLGDTIQNLLGSEEEPAKPKAKPEGKKPAEAKKPVITQYDSNEGLPEDDTFKNDFQRTIADMYGSPGDMAEQMQKSATMAASILPSAGVAGVGLRRMLGKGGSAALEEAAPAAQGLIASKLGRKPPPITEKMRADTLRSRVPPIREDMKYKGPTITDKMRADTLRSRVPAIRDDMKYKPKLSIEELQAADRAARQKGLKIDPKKIDREASDYRARGSRAPEPVRKSARSKIRR
jgi:hypothetical protein